VIRFHCPHCGAFLRAPDERAGRRAVCPGCRQKVPVPLAQPSADEQPPDEELVEVLPGDEEEPEEPPAEEPEEESVRVRARVRVRPRRRRRVRVDDEDEDEDDGPRRGLSRCPYCRSTFPPMMKKRISAAGWVVFAAVLCMSLGMCVAGLCFIPLLVVAFICLPLSILGLLLTTEERVCSECGARLG
jgi:hypothetical protein